MKTYQIIFKGGLTRYLRADGYRARHKNLVFHMDGRPVSIFQRLLVLMVDEVPEIGGPY